jgi:hydroxymethylglutaryl-CoA synthase
MTAGIERIGLYAGKLSLDLRLLATERGKDPEYVIGELMCEQRSVLPLYEDPVTMAVNAALSVLTDEDRASIELLIVATESGVDYGKPLSTWVHRFCRLPANCRNFEVKHACYGCTGALKMAVGWVASGVRPGKKALVINTDLSRSGLGSPIEMLGGACAVALLISDDPQILAIDPAESGYWCNEIADNLRPTATVELVADYISVYSYLDALEGAFEHFESIMGSVDYGLFRKHIYHAPFPGMTLQAHRTMLNRHDGVDREQVRDEYERKVAGGLHFARRIGSSYGGSTFVSLLGLLQCSDDLQPGDPISVFAYGGGCQAEFYRAVIGSGAAQAVRALNLDGHLADRRPLTVAQYERLERTRETYADNAAYKPSTDDPTGVYDDLYRGRGLLVLEEVARYIRRYGWS